MLTCINKSSAEFQTLKNRSGLSEFMVEAMCRLFLDKYNRFPYLDELPQSNSEPELRESLKVDRRECVKISDLEERFGDIQTAASEINNTYRDLDVELLPIDDRAFIDIAHRPTTNNRNVVIIDLDVNVNSRDVFENILDILSNKYGIQIIPITNAELSQPEWDGIVTEASLVNAFVYDGNIYLNTDNASVDAPIHEMMHLLIGSLRFKNSNLYQNMIELVSSINGYETLVTNYPNRTRNDVNEEIFVTEVSKYLTGTESLIDSMPESAKYEINYNVLRLIDTVLMGQDSVRCLNPQQVGVMTLKDLATILNSSIMKNQFSGTFNQENSALHRKLNNMKQELVKQRNLREECD